MNPSCESRVRVRQSKRDASLFHEFRLDKTARQVAQRAKSVLAADSSFFSPTSHYQRIRGIELHERIARSFVERVLARVPGETLLLTGAYLHFCEYLKLRTREEIT